MKNWLDDILFRIYSVAPWLHDALLGLGGFMLGIAIIIVIIMIFW